MRAINLRIIDEDGCILTNANFEFDSSEDCANAFDRAWPILATKAMSCVDKNLIDLKVGDIKIERSK